MKYIKAPSTTYSDQDDSTKNSIFLEQTAGAYSSYDYFLGYDFYYKIYPRNDSRNYYLLADYDTISTSPTVSYLVNLGYKRFMLSPTTTSTEPLVNLLSSSNEAIHCKITLDFSKIFISQTDSSDVFSNRQMAYVTLTNANTSTTISSSALYRKATFSSTPSSTNYPNYSSGYYKPWYSLFDTSFWSSFSADTDMSSSYVTSSSMNSLAVCVYAIAYGWTLEQGSIYSKPVPLGVIESN